MRLIAGRWLPRLGMGCLLAVGVVGNGAFADEEKAPATEKRAAIERLMELSKAADMGTQMGQLLAQQIMQTSGAEADEAAARRQEIVATAIGEAMGEFMDEVIPLYEKYFTHEEILGIIAFYESPIGTKSIEVMPQLMAETMQVGQRWAMTVMPKIQEKVSEQMREEGLIESEEESNESGES